MTVLELKKEEEFSLTYHFFEGATFTFEEDDEVAFWTPNRGLRSEVFEAFICRGVKRSRMRMHDCFLTGYEIPILRKQIAVCRTPPAWMPRDSILDSFKLILKMRGLKDHAKIITEALEEVDYFNWKSRPSLDDYPEHINDNYSRALALTRLLMIPYKLWVFDNPMHGQDGDRETLLMDILMKIHQRSGIKVFLADKPENIPSLYKRQIEIRADEEQGFKFYE
ncbi:MAG: hypothetical protein JKX97_06840 [Candidatus Lindowbacteria bacterium]|nr:hypothetical protein [Candidatus Lindowbacteria bacterium]